jgi:fused signal recognition particle receptor
MEELRKIHRVLGKAQSGAPHQVLLVLDATMGQNAIAQAKQFSEAVSVTQIVLSKLDGTAKGGVVIGICDELKLPVGFVGIGERAQDLRPFSPSEFVEALFEEA